MRCRLEELGAIVLRRAPCSRCSGRIWLNEQVDQRHQDAPHGHAQDGARRRPVRLELAAASAGQQARARPSNSLHRAASMIWDMAVGTMFPWPWAVAPEGGPCRHTNSGGEGQGPHRGGSACTADDRCNRFSPKEHDMRVDRVPRARKVPRATLNTRSTLVVAAQGVGLGHGLGQGHRQTGGGDGQKYVVDVVGGSEVAVALFAAECWLAGILYSAPMSLTMTTPVARVATPPKKVLFFA